MIQLVRCNNCYTIYEEDEENYEYIFTCKICNSDEYLMDIIEEETQ